MNGWISISLLCPEIRKATFFCGAFANWPSLPLPVFRKQSCMLGVGREEEMGESFPSDGFQWLEQIKGHSCFTFNWKQPNCKINPGSTCVHDDSIVTGFSESALTFCHVPSPDVLYTVLSARKTCSSAHFHQTALSDIMLNAPFFQNGRIQDKLLFLPIWEFIVNSQSSAVEINYPSSLCLNFLAQLKQHVFAVVAYSFPSFWSKELAPSPFPIASYRCDPASPTQCCLMVEVFAPLWMLSSSPWVESTRNPHSDAAISLRRDP